MPTSSRELVAIVQKLSVAKKIEDITDVVRRSTRTLIGADGVCFILRDEDQCFYAAEDAISPLWKGLRFPMVNCVSGWVMINRQHVCIQDIYSDPRVPVEAYRQTFVKSLLMVPVRREAPIAAIGVYWANHHSTSVEEIDIVQAIADITAVALENIQLYSSLEKRIEELRTATRVKDEFLMTISHELRTPLNAILGWLQVFESGITPEELEYGTAAMMRNAEAQMQMVDTLLESASLMTGRALLDKKPLDIAKLTFDAVSSFKDSASLKKITFLTSVDQLRGIYVHADEARLRRVIDGIISNAIKYSAPGADVHIVGAIEGTTVRIDVKDSGEGIEAEHLPNVFNRFSQVNSSRQRRYEGLGLSLAIAKQVIDLHEGKLEVTSAGPGQGATFIVRLNRLPEAALKLFQGPIIKDGSLEGFRVLVVDDHEDARILLATILKRRGAIVSTADGGFSAFNVLETFLPDIIVCDLSMPEEDGCTFLKRVRSLPIERGGKVPAIALTAYNDRDNEKDAMAAGFNLFMTKPLNQSQMIDSVIELMKRRS